MGWAPDAWSYTAFCSPSVLRIIPVDHFDPINGVIKTINTTMMDLFILSFLHISWLFTRAAIIKFDDLLPDIFIMIPLKTYIIISISLNVPSKKIHFFIPNFMLHRACFWHVIFFSYLSSLYVYLFTCFIFVVF